MDTSSRQPQDTRGRDGAPLATGAFAPDPPAGESGRSRWLHLLPWRLLAVAVVCVLLAILAAATLRATAGARVVAVSPTANRDDVPTTAPIRVTFSQAVDQGSVEARFRIEPETPGAFAWMGKEMAFRPRGALSPATTYTATLEAGAESQGGRSMERPYIWQFRTRKPQLLVLGRPQPGAGLRQLFVVSPDSAPSNNGAPPRQLTDHPHGVWDYAVHPLGEGIVYSVLRQDGGADLWRMDRDGQAQRLLLACPEAACLNPAWSPDGAQLAYERRELRAAAPNLDPEAGRIWLLDLERGDERPLFAYDVPLHSPVWSPEGDRLAYVSPMLPGVEVYNLQTEALQQFPNEWGAVPGWSPDGAHLVMPEFVLAGESLVARLVRVDLAGEALSDISGEDELVKDEGPAWSPGGGWIAFGRQFLDGERWTPGRQIWLTRPDASEAYGLPAEPLADRFALAWRPDGGALAYARTDLSQGPQPVPDVSVWLFDFVRGEPVQLAGDAVLPKWLP